MSQLRLYSAYDKTAAQSLFTNACNLVALDGNYGGSGAEYLQIFDKASVAVANDVPIASFLLSAAGPLPSIFEALGPVPLTLGLSVGISTVNEKYTASSSAFDVFGSVEEWETVQPGLTTITALGNALGLVSALDYLLWNNASGPQFLYRFTLTNAEGVTVYPMLFTTDATPSVGAVPLVTLPALVTGSSRLYHFGFSGLSPSDRSGSTTRKAGHIVISDTPNVLGTSTLTASASTILTAKYKAS